MSAMQLHSGVIFKQNKCWLASFVLINDVHFLWNARTVMNFEPFIVFFSPVYGLRPNEKTQAEAYQIFKMRFYRKKGFRGRETGKRYFLTKNVNNHCFTCMIRETTKPVIHLRTKAPLWDSNFLLPGRNCLALHSCPCIIVFYIFSLLFLSSAASYPAVRPNVSMSDEQTCVIITHLIPASQPHYNWTSNIGADSS